MRFLSLPLLQVLAVLLAVDVSAAELRGRVSFDRGRDADLSDVIVYYAPARAVEAPPPDEPFEVVTEGKQFRPRTMVVPAGSRVRFPNRDGILHNVFSVSGGNRFDLGLYRRGEGKEVRLRHPGVVQVFCNVHHSMVAYVVVAETPFAAHAGADGRFALAGLPPGEGTLTVWSERSDPWSRELELPHGEPLDVRLEVTRPRVPRHLNKFGRPYARSRGDRY